MKVRFDEEPVKETKPAKEKPAKEGKPEGKKGKVLSILLIFILILGVGIFALGLRDYLNNRRMEDQGTPSPVTEESLDTYLTQDGDEAEISNVPAEENGETVTEEVPSGEMTEEEAENEAALEQQELNQMSKMTGDSEARNEELQEQQEENQAAETEEPVSEAEEGAE